MKVELFSNGDPSVGISGDLVQIEIVGYTEESFFEGMEEGSKEALRKELQKLFNTWITESGTLKCLYQSEIDKFNEEEAL